MPLARTPLYDWHVHHGGRMMESDGWQIPVVYSSVDKEVGAARTGLALADLSAFAKTSLQGRDVPKAIMSLLGESPASKPRGVALLPENHGLACRLAEDHLLLLSSTTAPLFADSLASLLQGRRVHQIDVTFAYAGLGIVGAQAEAVLRQLTALELTSIAFPMGSCAETSLAGVQGLLVRTDLDVVSWRILVAWDLGEYIWECVLNAGHRFGITPLGAEGWRRTA